MITFFLNGREVSTQARPDLRLLDLLRDEFFLTGVKCGCREGECGACSVILDGRLVNSCLVAVGSLGGSSVLTIEGYRNTERFAVLDRTYGETGAVQCGFCTPGMILASECLLAKHPDPTDEEIRDGISGNLCRCTGYQAIVDAIRMAAKEGRGLW